MNRFQKIRMLGEATMTGYPTGTARSRCASPSGPKSPIPCGDHPGLDTSPLKKHATISQRLQDRFQYILGDNPIANQRFLSIPAVPTC